MTSFSAICCAFALLSIFHAANAKSMCTPMNPKMKATYEKIYDTDFMGCTLSPGEGMTAMSRMNWLTPVGSQPLIEMDTTAGSEMEGMDKVKGGSMMMAAAKVAGASVDRPGYLTVSAACAASLPPDMVYSLLAKSPSPKYFNAALEAACESGKTARYIKTSTHALDEATEANQALAVALICIIGSVLGLFFPAFDASLIAALKDIVETVFGLLPVVSATARTIETIGSA